MKLLAAIAVAALALPVLGQEAAQQVRLTAAEIDSLPRVTAGAGTSGLPAVTTTVLFGDPAQAGLYAIELRIASDTVIKAHRYSDSRTATVVSGLW